MDKIINEVEEEIYSQEDNKPYKGDDDDDLVFENNDLNSVTLIYADGEETHFDSMFQFCQVFGMDKAEIRNVLLPDGTPNKNVFIPMEDILDDYYCAECTDSVGAG